MTWNFDSSLARAQDRWDSTEHVTVGDVVRQMDFDNISLLSPKRLISAQTYVDITNFNALIRSGALSQQEAVRRLHLWQREASRITGGLEMTKVHFQGPRLHAVAYRPISDQTRVAAKAVLLGSALRHSLSAFNDVIATDDAWISAVGIDHGQVTVTRNGTNGDRELLFLGPAANHAAKILPKRGIRITPAVADLLPDDFETYLTETGDVLSVVISRSAIEELIDKYGWSWRYEDVEERLAEAAEKYPTSSVSVSKPAGKFDKDDLRLSNTKQLHATSVFADVDGFTAMIDAAANSDPDLVDAVRSFHTLRSEGRDIAVKDFAALRVQYQGDRMQALCHLPTPDHVEQAVAAVTMATALTSVASEIIPQIVPVGAAKPYAIGLATGDVLATKIGEHGNRDLVVIGTSVAIAAAIQGRLEGGEIGVDSATRDVLPDWMRMLFPWDLAKQAYVASGLTCDKLLAAQEGVPDDRAVTKALTALARTTGAYPPAIATPRLVPTTAPSERRPWLRDR